MRLSLALEIEHAASRVYALFRRVGALHDGPAPAGVLPLTLHSAGLPRGLYIVRITTLSAPAESGQTSPSRLTPGVRHSNPNRLPNA